jgi:hypothetical protein
VRVRAELFGSLALTGRGHGTDKAVLMGLEGHWPNRIDPDVIPAALERIRSSKRIRLHGKREIAFDEKSDLVMNKRQKLPLPHQWHALHRLRRQRREVATATTTRWVAASWSTTMKPRKTASSPTPRRCAIRFQRRRVARALREPRACPSPA